MPRGVGRAPTSEKRCRTASTAPSLVSPAEKVGRGGIEPRSIRHAHGGAHGAELRRSIDRRRRGPPAAARGRAAVRRRRAWRRRRTAAACRRAARPAASGLTASPAAPRPPLARARDVGVAGREHAARRQRRRRRDAVALDAAALLEVAAGLLRARRPRPVPGGRYGGVPVTRSKRPGRGAAGSRRSPATTAQRASTPFHAIERRASATLAACASTPRPRAAGKRHASSSSTAPMPQPRSSRRAGGAPHCAAANQAVDEIVERPAMPARELQQPPVAAQMDEILARARPQPPADRRAPPATDPGRASRAVGAGTAGRGGELRGRRSGPDGEVEALP